MSSSKFYIVSVRCSNLGKIYGGVKYIKVYNLTGFTVFVLVFSFWNRGIELYFVVMC